MNHLIIFRAGCDIFSLLSKMQKEGSNQSKNVWESHEHTAHTNTQPEAIYKNSKPQMQDAYSFNMPTHIHRIPTRVSS